MTSTREAVLVALKARLDTIAGPDVYRNEPLPKRVSEGGMLALFDGDPGEPDVLMSPLTYLYEHTAEIEVLIERKDNAERQTAFDALLRAVATAVHADRTLGGLCDWVEAKAPRPVDLPVEGAETMRGALVPVVLTYSTVDSLAD